MSVRFEWDENKDLANLVKHGVSFDEALQVFADPYLIVRDDRTIDGEERFHAIGYVERVLMIVHTVREKDPDVTIRIISARKATPRERRLYEESN